MEVNLERQEVVDSEVLAHVSPDDVMKRSHPKVADQAVKLTFKASPKKKPRIEDPTSDSDASKEDIPDFEGVSLEDLRLNPFKVVLRVATFGTKLL